MKLNQLALISLSAAMCEASLAKRSDYSDVANLLQWDNLGFNGQYFPVTEIEALNAKDCKCAKDYNNPVIFNGPISPFDEELSVQIRGPVNLLKFGWYYSDDYTFGKTEGNWTRGAYYDALQGQADNVTFLGNVGFDNVCLGKALTYVDETGIANASDSTVLGNVTIPSNYELTIMSDIECSGNDCGAFRPDSKAYHGYYGVNKMFLFEFNAPSDLREEQNVNKTWNYDMPAIWLLNAQIPRTAQYPLNPNCSAWNSGAGEFDIFEVMNVTERNHFYSTLHDFQGTDDIGTGIQNFAYLQRTPGAVMKGGVVFGQDGTASVFLSNSTSLDASISNADLESWLKPLEDATVHAETLSSISLVTEGSKTKTVSSIKSTSKSKGAAAAGPEMALEGGFWALAMSLVWALL